MRGRQTEDEETIQKRLQAVREELQRAESFDYKVINDNLEQAISDLEKVIIGEQKKC